MFKDNLALLRKQRKLTQRELAKDLGIAQSTLASYERGVREPNFEMLEKIANYFAVNMSALITNEYFECEKNKLLQFMHRDCTDDAMNAALSPYAISPEKQKLLEAVDGMSNEELVRLLKIIEAMK